MSRRRLLAYGAATAGAAGLTAVAWRARHPELPTLWDRSAFAPPGEARVAVLAASGYDADLSGVLEDGLRSIGADVAGAAILLKPNLVEYDPGTVINTDPRLVASAVLAFRRLGARSVIVGEGPGHRRDTNYVVERSGLGEVLRAVDAPFVDLNVDAVAPVRLRSSYSTLGKLWLPRSVIDADIVVSMPKMKTHHWAGVTLSLKNCFGCVPSRIYGWPKNVLHYAGLSRAILDVAGAVRPDLAIVDAIVAMQGNGPISGEPANVGAIVVGDDPVATDTVAAAIMGIEPERVPYLAEAARFLGQGNRDRISMRGDDPGRFERGLVAAPGFEGLSI